ncbi:hypothetical protein [Streptomyces sp. NPDC048644]|uniref:hypothetical protein n=1 Tax=Streptomyces sp. NPDC048644 TaxID=3365582 RepID=UPI00371C5DAC
MSERRRLEAERLGEAEEIVRVVDESLRELGVTLPSLRVDPVSCVMADPQPLIELGRCNLATARRLVEVLEGCRP